MTSQDVFLFCTKCEIVEEMRRTTDNNITIGSGHNETKIDICKRRKSKPTLLRREGGGGKGEDLFLREV